MYKKARDFSWRLFWADFLLLNISLLLMHYADHRSWLPDSADNKIFFSVLVTWMSVSLLGKKFRPDNFHHYGRSVWLYVKSDVLLAYTLSLIVVVFKLATFPRMEILGTVGILLFLETLVFSITYLLSGRRRESRPAERRRWSVPRPHLSRFLIVADILLFLIAFFAFNTFNRGTLKLAPDYSEFLVLFYGLWLAVSLITKKYDKANFQNYYYALAACVKTGLLVAAIMSVAIFAFRLFYFSRLQTFGTIFFLLGLNAAAYYLYFILKYGKNYRPDIESVEALQTYLGQEALPEEKKEFSTAPVPSHMRVLMDICGKNYPTLFEFVRRAVDFSSLEDTEVVLLNSPDLSSFDVLPDRTFRLLINFQRINDILRLNQFFLEVHKKLGTGGAFVGRVDTLELHKKRFLETFPRHYREAFYVLYFLVHRVMPKLPQTQKLYFALTRGKNRNISRAEALGRLYFCGFKVLAEEEIGGSLFFVAQKTKTPSLDLSPSYRPIIRLKRFGCGGRMIEIYKFRTMHPYSEYLQEYVYELNQLKEGGKIKDDFRVTEWGRFFRKHWLDELPMIYNWFRGEIKFFGVRPISPHYLSLYDAPTREMRNRLKPGLIPPYYADVPKDLEGIVSSEKKYLRRYLRHPWKTQFWYFLRVINNILFKGARSE